VFEAVLHDALKLAAQGEHAGKTDEGRMVQSRVLRRPASSRSLIWLSGVKRQACPVTTPDGYTAGDTCRTPVG
jgi:hypothetical protein